MATTMDIAKSPCPDVLELEVQDQGCKLRKESMKPDNIEDIDSHMGPLNFSLKLFGLVYTNSTKTFTPSKIYHGLVFLVMWFNFFKTFGIYKVGEPFGLSVIYKLNTHFVIFVGASNAAMGTLLCRKRPKMCASWWEYAQRFRSSPETEINASRRRRALAAVVMSWLCVTSSTITFAVGSINERVRYLLKLNAAPLIPACAWDNPIWDLIFSLIVQFANNVPTVFQLSHMLILICFFSDEFTIFNKQFKTALRSIDPDSGVGGHLELWRQRHQHLCGLVELLDECIGLHVLLMFVAILPVSSFSVYSIIMTMGHFSHQSSFVIIMVMDFTFLLVCIATLFGITYTGTKLNSQATACKQDLYDWDLTTQEWDATSSLQLTTFYDRLMEGHIGITGWKMFYINKLTAKMVILVIVSYSFILLKFGQHDREVPYLCPITPGNLTLTNVTSSS